MPNVAALREVNFKLRDDIFTFIVLYEPVEFKLVDVYVFTLES
jgi:hypothetical protein